MSVSLTRWDATNHPNPRFPTKKPPRCEVSDVAARTFVHPSTASRHVRMPGRHVLLNAGYDNRIRILSARPVLDGSRDQPGHQGTDRAHG